MGGYSTEIEEGEAFCYEVDDGHVNSFDPDVAFGYIDQKLQSVLGNFQKDFEGLVSAENLGPKFGEYGSFLPSYQRAPSILFQSKIPQRNCISSRSPVEGLSQHVSASPNIKPETVSSAVNLSQNARKPCGDVVHEESYVPSTHISKDIHSENKTAAKLSKTIKKGGLKIRIKMGSDPDFMKQKKAAICSGLGLEDTPSSSLGNSLETSEDALISHDTEEHSPTRMLEVMTSFPIAEGFLISPLSESLLSLVRNNGHEIGMNPVPTLRCGQEQASSLTERPASLPGETTSIKKRITESKIKRGRMIDIRQVDGNSSESNITSVKKKIERILWDGKTPQSNDLKPTSLATSSCDAERSAKVVVREPDACRTTGRDDIKRKLDIADLAKVDSLESIVGQESGKSKKPKINRSFGKVGDNRKVKSSMGALMHLTSNEKCKADQLSASPQAPLSVSRPMVESKLFAPPKQKLQKSVVHEHSETRLASRGEKSLDEGKRKVKEISGCSKLAVIAKTKSLKGRNGGVRKKEEAASSVDQIVSKVHNSMSEEVISKVQKIRHDMDTTSKEMDRQMDMRKVSGHRTKVTSHAKAKSDKLKGRSTARGTDDQLMSGATVKNELQRDLPGLDNGLTSDVAPAATAPVLIAEDWVCCDLCEKWRLLPYGTKPEHLPEKWLCSMLNWLPGMNRCDISEEETTEALNKLYQPLPTQDQNKFEAQKTGSACQSTSGGVRHLDQTHQKLNSSGMSIPQKKKSFSKELPETGNSGDHVQIMDVVKNKQQDSLKSRSLSDMSQNRKESKLVKKSHDLTGGSNKIKMKYKKGDQHGSDVVKKTKLQSVQHTYRNQNTTDTDTGKLGLSSSAELLYKEKEVVAHNHDEHCSSEDPKSNVNIFSSKEQPQHSSNSIDVRIRKKRGILSSKRKLKDLQIDQGNHIQYSSESGHRENKKLKAMKTERADKNIGIGEIAQQGRGKMAKVPFSNDSLSLTGGTEEISGSYYDQQPKNCQRKITSKPKVEAIDGLRCDMGSNSIKASSPLKFSGSLKAKGSYDEVKSSPVESVSSSPLKTAKTDKQPSAEEDIAEKDYSAHCDLPVMPKPRQLSSGRVVEESNRTGTLRKQEHFSDSRNVLALDNCNAGAGNKFSSSGRSFKVPDTHLDNCVADKVEKDFQCASDLRDKDVFRSENRIRKQHCHKGLLSGNDSSLLTTNKNYTSDVEKGKMEVSEPKMGLQRGEMSDGRELDGLHLVMLEEQPLSGRKTETQYSFEHLSPNKHAARELDALNPSKKVFSSRTIADVLKEAMFLRDKADHLKCSGFGFESNETYFQAAIKFLYGASNFETCNGDIGKQAMSEMQMYMTAAKLFENCAREFENRQEMAAAALAYKGSEVAYMRVVYCKSSNMSKDLHELNECLQIATKGESPSSSASDVDNSNNPAAVDKDNISKTAGSYGSENHAVISCNRPNYAQLLDFTQDVSSAMEASRKSQIAFAAANLNLREAQKQECIDKVKRVVDFSFHDVDGLVRLIEQARKALSS